MVRCVAGFILGLMWAGIPAQAQEKMSPGQFVVLHRNDGSVISGRVVTWDSEQVRLASARLNGWVEFKHLRAEDARRFSATRASVRTKAKTASFTRLRLMTEQRPRWETDLVAPFYWTGEWHRGPVYYVSAPWFFHYGWGCRPRPSSVGGLRVVIRW